MIVIKNKFLPIGKRFYAINLFGIIFSKGDCSRVILNHEQIHTKQILELFIIPFYLFYIMEWILRMIIYRDSYKAYQNISFEKEAYANQEDFEYLKKRKTWNFLIYISK